MYIFDTNAIYFVGKLLLCNPQKGDQLIEAVKQQKTLIAYTSLAIIELVSGIDKNPNNFAQIQKGLEFLLNVNSKHLPDPEGRRKEIITGIPAAPQNYNCWNDHAKEIVKANNINNLYRRDMVAFREKSESTYVDDMTKMKCIINNLPEYKKIKTEKEKRKFITMYFKTEEWTGLFLSTMAQRVNIRLPQDLTAINKIISTIKYHKEVVEILLQKTMFDYKNLNKYKNDYHDTELSLYLDDIIATSKIVSDDIPFKKRLPSYPSRIITFNDFFALHIKSRINATAT